MTPKTRRRLLGGVLWPVLALVAGCVAKPTAVQFPPFSEPQMGDYAVRFTTVPLHLNRNLTILVRPAADARTTRYTSLERFWYDRRDDFGRNGQPEQADAAVYPYMLSALNQLDGVKAVSVLKVKRNQRVDLVLEWKIREARVYWNGFNPEYQGHVTLEVSLNDMRGRAVQGFPVAVSATAVKDAPPPIRTGNRPTPIYPLMDQTFEKALQLLLYHDQFLRGLRAFARG